MKINVRIHVYYVAILWAALYILLINTSFCTFVCLFRTASDSKRSREPKLMWTLPGQE